ncbi:MAG: hypothetical protein ACRC3Z_11100 [Phocaeicola sp.]
MKRNRILIALGILFLSIAFIAPELLHADESLICMAAAPVFTPLKFPQGKNNMAGYKPRLLFIPEFSVTTLPVVGFDETKNSYVAAGIFDFIGGAGALTKPLYLYSTDGKVSHSSEPQGELDGISYKQNLGFFFPGNMPEMHLFNAMVKNTRGYYVFEDVDGQQYLFGEEGLPAATSPSFNGGAAKADARGTTYTATCDSNYTAVLLGTPIDMQAVGGYKPEAGE